MEWRPFSRTPEEYFASSDSITATCHAELGYPMVIDIKL